MSTSLDTLDRAIINRLQIGFPVVDRPFQEVASELGIDEDALIVRVDALVKRGVLSRFGALWNAERLGGAVTLAALVVPPERFDEVAALVNAHPEVAHNYARDHHFNMWFVVAAEQPSQIAATLAAIEAETGLRVLDLPKLAEYRLVLRLAA